MPQTVCFGEYFPDNGQLLGAGSKGIIPINLIHAGLYGIPDTGRPFIPIVGVIPSPTGTGYVPDTLANNVTYSIAFIRMFIMAYQASINFSQDVLLSPQITSDRFAGYLYKKNFSNTPNLNRYYDIAQMVYQFYQTAGAWTAEQFYDNLTDLMNKLGSQADKFLYIPNANYTFDNAVNTLGATLDAWKVTTPSLFGFAGVEIYI